MHYKWVVWHIATERICSAVLLNCTKARIEPLFELNRTAAPTAASVASSNNGMPTFSTPSTQKKKIPAECWRAKKIICKRILEKKNFIVNQGVEKKFHDQTKSPTPPPPLRSRMVGPLYLLYLYSYLFSSPRRRFVLQTEISGTYIQLFVFYFISVTIFSPCRKDQFAVLTF